MITPTVNVQTKKIPVDVKERAEEQAKKQGFSTLQDAIRVYVAQLAEGAVKVSLSNISNQTLRNSTKNYSINELRLIVERVFSKYPVKKAYLFGSRARGDYTKDSDYDIFIEPTDEKPNYIQRIDMLYDLQEALNKDVDLSLKENLRPEFIHHIFNDATEIYEKE